MPTALTRFLPWLVCAQLSVAALRGQNFDHGAMVFVDKAGWLSREEAQKRGCFEYEHRWYLPAMQKKLAAWALEDQQFQAWSKPRTLVTKHYHVISNAPRFILELEIVPFLDELYDTYVKVFKEHYGLESKAANQKTIKIHRSYFDYRDHEADKDGPPPRTNPAFILGGDELVTYYDDTDPGEFYSSAFHEGAHQFMSAVLPGAELPVWLDEAMAVYFEGCTYSRATKKITVNFLPPDRLDHAQEQLTRVAQPSSGSLANQLFFQVPKERFDAGHYALAWSFVYYLLNRDGAKYRKHFAAFLKATNGAGTRPIPEIWKRATKLDLDSVEQGWREAVLALKPIARPRWVQAEVTTTDPAVDIKDGDRVWSIDGVEVFDEPGCQRVWLDRKKDHPTPMVLVRRTNPESANGYSDRFVVTAVPPDSTLVLAWTTDPNRACSLRD